MNLENNHVIDYEINNMNDIFYTGRMGNCVHYNGSNYNELKDLYELNSNMYLDNMDYNGDIVVMVGRDMSSGSGVIVRGKRIK